ncbi:MAG: hypothetical protein Pars93KO_27840 [Parasphingorhabdus sp.]
MNRATGEGGFSGEAGCGSGQWLRMILNTTGVEYSLEGKFTDNSALR